jgi:hypothetical protein
MVIFSQVFTADGLTYVAVTGVEAMTEHTQSLDGTVAELVSACTPALLSDYIDKPALARELGRTPRTVDRLTLCAGLPYVQIGTRRLFRRSAVLEWLRSRETCALAKQA